MVDLVSKMRLLICPPRGLYSAESILHNGIMQDNAAILHNARAAYIIDARLDFSPIFEQISL